MMMKQTMKTLLKKMKREAAEDPDRGKHVENTRECVKGQGTQKFVKEPRMYVA